MSRNGIGRRSQFYMNSPLNYDFFSSFQTGKHLYAASVGCTDPYLNLLVAVRIQFLIHKIGTLFFGQRTDRKRDYSVPFFTQQEYFGECPRKQVTPVIQFESHRNIERRIS